MSSDSANNALSNFEHLWNEVNNKYSYFEYKSIDWQEVYNPQVEHIESGVPVDIALDLNPEDEANGVDTILETALDILRISGKRTSGGNSSIIKNLN